MTIPRKLIFQVSMVLVLPLMLLILLCLTQILIQGRIFFEVRGDDVNQSVNTNDPLHVSYGAITRSKANVLKEALNGMVVQISAKIELRNPLEHQKEALIYMRVHLFLLDSCGLLVF